jgi:hypothetical protein
MEYKNTPKNQAFSNTTAPNYEQGYLDSFSGNGDSWHYEPKPVIPTYPSKPRFIPTLDGYDILSRASVNFSVLTATTPQNKVFSLGDNGKLIKSSSVNPYAGNFKTVSIDSLEQFADGLTRLKATQSLILGTIKGLSAGESIGLCTKGKESQKQISKTLDFISYTDTAGFMLVDIDQAGHYTDFLKLVPEIKSAVIKPSSSSFVFDSNGNEVIGAKGWHIFIPVANQTEIPAIAETLWQRQWLSGHGHYLLSAGVNPAMLERGLFDKAVFSPERLIFEAKPTLNNGLIQNAPAPIVIGTIEQSLKLSDFVPYSANDLLKIESLKAAAREAIKPAQKVAIKAAKRDYIEKSGLPAKVALTNYKQLQNGTLTHDFEVITQKYGKVKIADLLANPTKFNNCTLADPNDPDYDGGSKTKARFYWNNGVNPIINSQAHGGIKYRINTEPEKSVISDNTESVTTTLACLLSYVPLLEKSVIHAIKDKSHHCKTCHKAFTPKRVHHTQCPGCFFADSKQTKPQYKWIDHTQHDVNYVNQRYLNVPPTEGKVNIYISTQGTGKTYGAVNFVKSLPAMSVLYIAHLVTLVFQAARKFGIECYSDHKKLNEHDRLAICINSIFKLIDAMGRFLIYDTVVLDEIEQQLTRMIGTGKDAIKNKPLVFSVLCHLIKNAKTLVCLDADTSLLTLNLLQKLRPNERFNVIINEWQDTEITHYIYENEADIVNLTRAAIAKNEPALLMTNGLNKSIELDNLIECDNKIVINSKTSGLAAVKEFVNDVNEQCKKYLLGIFSPTVNTGFSIESGHFKWNLGIFKSGKDMPLPLDWFQQLLRDRITKDKHVYIEDKKTSYHAPRYDVAHDFNMMVCSGYGDLVYNDPLYAQLVADVQARDASFMADPKAAYVRIAKERGHKVIFVKDTATAEQITVHKEAQKTIKVERELLRVDSICTIEEPISSHEEYQAALKEPRPTPELLLKIEHFEIRDVYATAIEKSVIAICEADPTRNRATVEQEVFRQFVIDDDGCKRRKQIENLRLATSTYNEARELQIKKATGKFKEDVDYIFPKYLLLTQLFKAVGINPDLSLSKEVYTSDDLKEFFEWVEDERELIASFWAAMPTKEVIAANPYRYVRTLLNTVGISQTRKQKKIDKKTTFIGYAINADDLQRSHFFLLIKETPESVTFKAAA